LEAGVESRDRIACELVAESLRAGHDVQVRVAGSSMVPALWPGDALIVRAVSPVELSRGDLLLFARDGKLCTHRLIAELDDSGARRLITRGDTSLKCDPPMSSDQILGSVVSVSRDGHEVPVLSSRRAKMLSFGIRHSAFLRRVILKVHALRRRSELLA
jgi:hypothetical protein